MSNPTVVEIPANSLAAIDCMSNAALLQRVTLTTPDAVTVTFEGSGEGVPMTLGDGSSIYQLPSLTEPTVLSILFEFSFDGENFFAAGTVNPPQVASKDFIANTVITSEDGTDGDNNDSTLSIFTVTPPTQSQMQAAKATADAVGVEAEAATGGQLEMHAKTYYDTLVPGGDEHYVTIPVPSSASSDWTTLPFQYNGTNWTIISGSKVEYMATPLGGYYKIGLGVAYSGEDLDFAGATLTLLASASYWGSFPTGSASMNWEAALYNCRYHITYVTN